MRSLQSIKFCVKERGAATLLFSVVLLVAMTVTIFFAAQTAVLEERMAANQVRMTQAATSAQAGLERAMAYAQDGGGEPREQFAADAANGRNSFYRAAFVSVDAVNDVSECPQDPEQFVDLADGLEKPENLTNASIWSCGWSDDLSGRKGVSLSIRGASALGSPPNNPLTARGGVSTNGRARVFNAYNNLTIWTGEELSVTGNPGNTFIRNPNESPLNETDPRPPEPANCTSSGPYICTTDANTIGPDVISGDLQLSSTSNDDFFSSFMGQPPNQYRDGVATQLDPELASLEGMTNEVVWISGDFDSNQAIGAPGNPVVLVVDGNATLSGNFQLYGVLYVRGDLRANGTPTVYGTSLIEGDTTSASGTPYFVYDPESVAASRNLGARGALTGSWRDWPRLAP